MMSDLIDQARFQIDRYDHTTKGTSLSLVNTIERLQAKIKELEANIITCVRKEWAPLDDITEADALDWFAKEYPAALQENK